MEEDGSQNIVDYVDGWVETMNELESESNQNHVPFTRETVLDEIASNLSYSNVHFNDFETKKPIKFEGLNKAIVRELTIGLKGV